MGEGLGCYVWSSFHYWYVLWVWISSLVRLLRSVEMLVWKLVVCWLKVTGVYLNSRSVLKWLFTSCKKVLVFYALTCRNVISFFSIIKYNVVVIFSLPVIEYICTWILGRTVWYVILTLTYKVFRDVINYSDQTSVWYFAPQPYFWLVIKSFYRISNDTPISTFCLDYAPF